MYFLWPFTALPCNRVRIFIKPLAWALVPFPPLLTKENKHEKKKISNSSIITIGKTVWSCIKPGFQDMRVTASMTPLPLADAAGQAHTVVLEAAHPFRKGSLQKHHLPIGSGRSPHTLDKCHLSLQASCAGCEHSMMYDVILSILELSGCVKKSKQRSVWNLNAFHNM